MENQEDNIYHSQSSYKESSYYKDVQDSKADYCIDMQKPSQTVNFYDSQRTFNDQEAASIIESCDKQTQSLKRLIEKIEGKISNNPESTQLIKKCLSNNDIFKSQSQKEISLGIQDV